MMTDPLKIGPEDELEFLLKGYTNLKDNNVLISTCTIVLWNENAKSMLQEGSVTVQFSPFSASFRTMRDV